MFDDLTAAFLAVQSAAVSLAFTSRLRLLEKVSQELARS
jgi:hypothetical protein